MIPPVTGNGMSMALEGADLAAPLLEAYSTGRECWDETQAQIASRSARRFRVRLKSAQLLHLLLFSRVGQSCLLLGSQWRWLWNLGFGLTR